jgi:hypothetical protein
MKKPEILSLINTHYGDLNRNLNRFTILLALLILSNLSYAQGKLMSKIVAKVGSKVGAAGVVSSSTLDDLLPTVGIGSNLHPTELGTISQAFFKDWTTGGQQVFIMFSKKNSPGFYKIDGSVKINGMEIDYVTSGMYSIIGGTSDSPRKVDIVSSSGQKSSFVIKPSNKPIKLISINGSKKDEVALDLTKDVTLEVEGISATDNQLIKVSLAINQLGIKSIYDVCFVRAGSTLTIPAAAFRNINIVPGGDALYNYKKSYLSVGVESIENATEVTGSIPSVQYTSSYSDGKFVTVNTEPNLNTGLVIKGTEANMDYDFFKPGAFLSRPVSQIKKLGVISFSIRGTTYQEVVIGTSESSTTIYTTSAKLTFPQQSNEVWDGLLAKLYPELMTIVKSELNADDITIDKITSSDAYKSVQAFAKDDANTKVEFARSYRDTKVLSAAMPVGEGFGPNSVNQRIMNETGADALLTMTLDLEISWEEKNAKSVYVLMIPKFSFELVGKSNGNISNTKYITGTIKSTTGVRVAENMTPDELEKIIRKSDLLTVFRKGLQETIAKEKANTDYETVWSLQK